MVEFDGRARKDIVFRLILIALLVAIATLQFLILQRLPAAPVTLKDIREAKDPKTRQVLRSSVPLVAVYGAVEVQGYVDVSNTVDVNITNEPLPVEAW
ncbi:MAG TPA: hypothetical protein VF789_29590 [Thermoanaerobaculia bacterium]